MAKASEQFRQSDVAIWGIVALAVGSVAVMGANISAVIPQGLLASLHKTRIEGASMEQLRSQVAVLRSDLTRLTRENNLLAARFAVNEQQGLDITRRVGAVEVSLPKLLEAMPPSAQIDRTNLTAALGTDPALVYQAEGGSVVVRQRPMPGLPDQAATLQPLPAPINVAATTPVVAAAATPARDSSSYAVAVGPEVSASEAPAVWRDLTMKLGPLLFGMAPLLSEGQDPQKQRIVVGPIAQNAEASTMCARLEQLSVSCSPVRYTGAPMSVE